MTPDTIDPRRPFRGSATFYADHRYQVSPTFVELVAARLRLTRADRVLDLGCGPGTLARLFAPHVGEVLAVDVEPEMVEEGARRCAAAGVDNVQLTVGDAHDLAPIADRAPFRVVTIGQAFHWMRPQERVLEQLADLTDTIALITPTAVGPGHEWWADLDRLVERHLGDLPADAWLACPRPFEEILRASAFDRCEELRLDYDTWEQPNLAAAMGVRCGTSWIASRLGDRRTAMEAEARAELGWIDDLPPRVIRRRDSALFGYREDHLCCDNVRQ